jgi:hypothetical protein
MILFKWSSANCKQVCWGNPKGTQLARICVIRMGKRTKQDMENCPCKQCIIKVNCSKLCLKRQRYKDKISKRNNK